MSRDEVLLFAKYPSPGKVKTRLSPVLGEVGAAELHACFMFDIINMLAARGGAYSLWYDPPEAGDEFRALLGSVCSINPQQGADLGERMANALTTTLAAGANKAVVIGSDSPDLPAHFIDDAMNALDAADVVIGPAADGGYYLVGVRSSSATGALFTGILWSSPSVFHDTVAAAAAAGLRLHRLPLWWDVDTPADLTALIERRTNKRGATWTDCFLEALTPGLKRKEGC